MAIIIPKKGERAEWVRPFDVDGDVSKYAAPAAPVVNPVPVQASNLGVANINPREYIQVGINGLNGKPVAISAYELQGSNSKNYEDANKFVLNQGLYMPTPKIFMTHFLNVISAKEGNTSLSYADGTKVPTSEAEEMYKHLTKNHRDVFANGNSGAWTWLNAGFVKGRGCLSLDLETVTGLNNDGTLKVIPEPLEECMDRDTFVSLNFNRQGLAKFADVSQKYKAGENIYFYAPRSGSVARFIADSGGVGLVCGGGPAGASPALGVFGCAEGAAPKN